MEDKREILSMLYSLRAGLSLVSSEKDKSDKKLDKYNDLNYTKKELLKNKKEEQVNLANAEKSLYNAKNNNVKILATEKYNKELIKKEDHYKSSTFWDQFKYHWNLFPTILILVFIGGLAFGLFLLYDSLRELSGPNPSGIDRFQYGFSFFVLGIAGLSFLILFIFILVITIKSLIESKDARLQKKKLNEFKKNKDAIIEKYIKDISANNKNKVFKCETNIKNYKKSIDDIDSHVYDLGKESNIVQLEIDEIALKSSNIYDSLVKQYSKILDERDWKNVDLIIYYIETGRADTIKESLQLLDRKLDSEEIKHLIIRANKNITSVIETNVNKLAGFLGGCFEKLSKQINDYNKTVNKVFVEQSNKINALNDSILSIEREVVSQAQLNKALIAKANETSEKLVNDSAYMRELATQAEIRRRNNF